MSVAPVVEPRASSPGAANRKAQTQQKILRASMELFSTRGYHRTSTAQIAARAGVSRASIFWHFSDKGTLFGETCRHFLVPFRASLERGREEPDPRKRILHRIDAYDSFIREQRGTIRAFLSWIFTSPPHAAFLRKELLSLHRDFQSALERDLSEILVDPAEAPGLAAIVASALHGDMLLNLGASAGRAESPRAIVERLLRERLALLA